jgi:transcriptional regulator with XRE-family HTH domain
MIMLDTTNATTATRYKVKSPSPVDVAIGRRIRMRRKMLSMSQTTLATALGVTFQQVQKYERGANRVGGSRMQRIAEVLQTKVAFFFDDTPDDGRTSEENEILAFASTTEGLALIRAFSKITSEAARKSIIGIAETVANKTSAH